MLDCYGVGRVMYGGDWPVSTLASTYDQWFETLSETIGSRYSDDEQRQLLHDNAVDFYRLG